MPLGQCTSRSAVSAFAQAEVHAQIALRNIAAAAAHFVHLPVASESCNRSRAPIPERLDFTPTVLILIQLFFSVLSQRSNCGTSLMQFTSHVQIAVVIEIADGAPSPGHLFENARTRLQRYVLKLAVSAGCDIAPCARDSRTRSAFRDFRIDVPVADQDIGPSVVVEVDEADAPAQKPGVPPKSGLKGLSSKLSSPRLRYRVDVSPAKLVLTISKLAVAIVIGRGHSHAGLRFAVRADRPRPLSIATSVKVPS